MDQAPKDRFSVAWPPRGGIIHRVISGIILKPYFNAGAREKMAKKRKGKPKDEGPDIGETQDMNLDDFEEVESAEDAAAEVMGAEDFEAIDDGPTAPDTLELETELPTDIAGEAVPEEAEEPEVEKPKKKSKFPKRTKTRIGKGKKKKKGDEEKKKDKTVAKIDKKKIRMKGKPDIGATGPKPFPVICIECYEEFIADPGRDAKVIHCPECDHPAKMPEEEFLEKWTIYKRAERNRLIGAIVSFTFMAILAVIWVLLLAKPENAKKGALNMVFPAFMLISFMVGVFFAIIYERGRHEAYF
jgi:hypothetical protein